MKNSILPKMSLTTFLHSADDRYSKEESSFVPQNYIYQWQAIKVSFYQIRDKMIFDAENKVKLIVPISLNRYSK